jgi:hypothetical protein
MATRPSPPGTIINVALAFCESGTVAGSHATVAGSDGDGVALGVGSGDTLGVDGADDGDGVGTATVVHAVRTTIIDRTRAAVARCREELLFMSAASAA